MRRIDPWFAIGLVAFFALLFVALFGERIAPYEPIFFTVNRGDLQRPFAPGEVFPLGSDVLGRDLFSLVLAGARATLLIGVVAGLARVLSGAHRSLSSRPGGVRFALSPTRSRSSSPLFPQR